jgi:hypothetical protein
MGHTRVTGRGGPRLLSGGVPSHSRGVGQKDSSVETLQQIVERVSAQVWEHCRAKGYTEGPWLNPLVPVDCVSAWAMARHLASAGEIGGRRHSDRDAA